MAFDAYFFNFQKKTNSTKAPTQSQWESGLDAKINLLGDTSLTAPVFKLELQTPPMANATQYNYCYVPDFHRFYFIDDWSCERNIWSCSCSCDVLASFRDAIRASTQYILRSASEYDLRIIDTIYPTKSEPTFQLDEPVNALYNSANTGSDVIATVQTLGSFGSDVPAGWYPLKTASAGFLYAIDMNNLKLLFDYLIDDYTTWVRPSTDLTYETSKLIFNPFEYIKSIRIYPFTSIYTPSPDVGMSPITYGFWKMPAYAYRLTGGSYTREVFIALHAHPQISQRGWKMNGAPFTQRTLHFEPFGDIPLDCSAIVEAIGITIQIIVDLNTGMAKYMLKPVKDVSQTLWTDNPNCVIASGYAQMGFEVPLVQMKTEVGLGDVIPTAVKGGIGLGIQWSEAVMNADLTDAFGVKDKSYHGSYTNGTVSSIGIGDALQASTTKMQTKGGGGSQLPCFYAKPFVSSFFYEQVDENIIDHGRPLCQRRSLGSLSGYCICENAELSITGLASEEKAICNLLNSGVYIE